MNREIGDNRRRKVHRVPARGKQTLRDPALDARIRCCTTRSCRAYLAGVPRPPKSGLADEQIGIGRARRRCSFVIDNFSRAGAPATTAISQLGLEALIETGSQRGEWRESRCPENLSKPRVAGDDRARRYEVGETLAIPKGQSSLPKLGVRIDFQYAAKTPKVPKIRLLMVAAGDQQVLHHGHRRPGSAA